MLMRLLKTEEDPDPEKTDAKIQSKTATRTEGQAGAAGRVLIEEADWPEEEISIGGIVSETGVNHKRNKKPPEHY